MIAAMISKALMPKLLDRIGYRRLLVTNTVAIGVFLMLFATIWPGTPLWLIVAQAFGYGALTSMQYTAMNTLVYADIPETSASGASSIASTFQQLSISFGVAVAGLIPVVFMPDQPRSDPSAIIMGLHRAFLALGFFTVGSTVVFRRLKPDDGTSETRQKDIHLG